MLNSQTPAAGRVTRPVAWSSVSARSWIDRFSTPAEASDTEPVHSSTTMGLPSWENAYRCSVFSPTSAGVTSIWICTFLPATSAENWPGRAAGASATVRAGGVCTSTDDTPRTRAASTSSTRTTRRSRRGSAAATIGAPSPGSAAPSSSSSSSSSCCASSSGGASSSGVSAAGASSSGGTASGGSSSGVVPFHAPSPSAGAGAARRLTRPRATDAALTSAASRTTLVTISQPYVVPNSAAGVPTSTSAPAVPPTTSTPTATIAQRDHTGRIAPSSATRPLGSRYRASTTSPPSHTAMAPMWLASVSTVSGGTDEALGCPDSGQVSTATAPSRPSRILSARPVRPLITRYSNGSAAISAPNRVRCAAPYRLPSTAARSDTLTDHGRDPVVYGAWRYSAASVPATSSPNPVHTSRPGHCRDSRRGHSETRNTVGPTTSSNPAKPRYRAAGSATATTGSVRGSATAGGCSDGAPTENVNAPAIGWLSAEMTR